MLTKEQINKLGTYEGIQPTQNYFVYSESDIKLLKDQAILAIQLQAEVDRLNVAYLESSFCHYLLRIVAVSTMNERRMIYE